MPVTVSAVFATRVGGSRGTTDGGVYDGADGVRRYVKFYNDATHAGCELLATRLYAELGIDVPAAAVFNAAKTAAKGVVDVPHGTTWCYATDWLHGAQALGAAGVTEARARRFLRGLVADAWLANWDVVGAATDNVVVVPARRERLVRLDNGGALLMRARGARKAEHGTALDAFFDAAVNPTYAAVASKAGYRAVRDLPRARLVNAVADVLDLQDRVAPPSDDGSPRWEPYVLSVAPFMPPSDVDAVCAMLERGAALLQTQLAALEVEDFGAPRRGSPRVATEPLPLTPPSVAGAVTRAHIAALERVGDARRALKYFTGHLYKPYNATLRAAAGTSRAAFDAALAANSSPRERHHLDVIHTHLRRAFTAVPPLPAPLHVYRGVSGTDTFVTAASFAAAADDVLPPRFVADALAALAVGDMYAVPTYTSTTFDPATARNFISGANACCLLHIALPRGHVGALAVGSASTYDGEAEVLLAPTHFVVTGLSWAPAPTRHRVAYNVMEETAPRGGAYAAAQLLKPPTPHMARGTSAPVLRVIHLKPVSSLRGVAHTI